MKSSSTFYKNKSTLFLLILTLIVGGVGAQAGGLLNTDAGGYVFCVNSKTQIVTQPAKGSCPKGSKKLVIGARGLAGTDGLSFLNGVKDPENSVGVPGDMFLNSETKTLFGPKNLDGTWPVGVSLIAPRIDQGRGGSGPAGPAGPAGASGIKITELTICGTLGTSLCKNGLEGPGGGTIFFIDYLDQYPGFNYLEIAPFTCQSPEPLMWSSNTLTAVDTVIGLLPMQVGSGQANTTAILAAVTANTIVDAPAAAYADALICGGKNDWFLGSPGEMTLLSESLEFHLASWPFDSAPAGYWTSAAPLEYYDRAYSSFGYGTAGAFVMARKDTGTAFGVPHVRPIRSF